MSTERIEPLRGPWRPADRSPPSWPPSRSCGDGVVRLGRPEFAEYVVGSSEHPGRRPSRPQRPPAARKRRRSRGRARPHLQPAGGRLRQPRRDLQMRGGRLRAQHTASPAPRPDSSASSPTTRAPRTRSSGTAPVYNMRTIDEEETARLAFVAPLVNIPIGMPVSVRSGSDYGLKMTARSISQSVALSVRRIPDLGLPRRPRTRFGTVPSRRARRTARPASAKPRPIASRAVPARRRNCRRRSSTTRASAPATNCR